MNVGKALAALALIGAILHVVTEGESTIYWARRLQGQ